LSTSQEFTTQQLAAARAARWHQNGSGLLTIESLRDWLNDFGLVLFVPRTLQIPAPAPSFAEAILGMANPGPGVAEMEQARGMLARLAAEGAALPLNLLGSVGDAPDYVVSTQIFSYIFTLRGDKAWKQPPSTAGAVKVSQLGLSAYEMLAERGAMSTAQLVTELGREVTEAAVLRALSELWGQMRVIATPQADGASTTWELTTKRFTRQIKAGINAGQPKALSALISLYLGQAVAATEEEVVTFLSPLAARSRIREVLHALMAGQQLETVVLEGKTLLHVAGELPVFEASPETEAVDSIAATAEQPSQEAPAPRISKYKAKVGAERERRPFQRDKAPRTYSKPSFTKPWEEEKASRPAAAGSEGEKPAFPAQREYGERPPRKSFGERPKFGDRPSFGGDRGDRPRKTFGDKPGFGARPSFGDRDSRPPRKSFGDKPSFGARPRFGGDREGGAPRKTYGDKPSFGARPSFGGDRGDRPRKTYGDKPSFGARPSFGDRDSRPPRKSFGDKPSFGARPRPSFGGDREGGPPRRTFGDKPGFGARARPSFGDRDSRPPRKSFGDKPSFGARPSFGGERGDRPQKPFGDRPAFKPRSEGEGERKPFRKFDAPAGERKPFRKFDGPRPDGERKPFSKPGFKSFDKKPGGFGGKKFGGKPGGFGGKTGYTGKPKGKFGSYTKPKYPGLPTGSGPKSSAPRKPKDEAGS